MKCPFCDKEIDDSHNICPICGNVLPVRAPSIYTVRRDNNKKNDSKDEEFEELDPDKTIIQDGNYMYTTNSFGGFGDILRSFAGGGLFDDLFGFGDFFGNADMFEEKDDPDYEMTEEERQDKIAEEANVCEQAADGSFHAVEGKRKDKKNKKQFTLKKQKKSLLYKLYNQLILAILFGYSGVPALFRTSKGYGIYQIVLFVTSVVLTFTVNFWQLFIIIGIQYFIDVATIVLRICVYKRGKKYLKHLLKQG